MKKSIVFVLTTIVFLLLFSMTARAQLKVTSLFSDQAVVQSGQPIRIWGTDLPGNEVVCSIAGVQSSSYVSEEGSWFMELDNKLEFNQNYRLRVESESGELAFSGLVLGDVWVASGQSNMFRFINTTVDTTGDIQYLDTLMNDQFENLRMFSIQPKESSKEERFIDPPVNSWQRWIKMNAFDFIRYQSAVAYYTGRRLHKELNYPIGIIVAAKGATEIEEWSPAEAADPDLRYSIPTNSYFNGMIAPIIPLSISGVIWYQGENNSGQSDFYAEKTVSCFNSWQNRWSRNFPVFTTLLAGFRSPSFRRLRSEQLLAARSNDDIFIASAFDLGILDDIHPYQKKAYSERLASLILNEYYSVPRHPHLYPTIDSTFHRNDSLLVKISNSEGLKSQNEPLSDKLFESFDQDGSIIETEAIFLSDSIIYLNTFGQTAQNVEYNYVGFADNHIRLYGLPMHPYSSQFDTSFEYAYDFQPTQYLIEDTVSCQLSSNEPKTLLIDSVMATGQIRYINVSRADTCVILTRKNEELFSIYPNPSTGKIYFEDTVNHVSVYSTNGKVILERENVSFVSLEGCEEKLVMIKISLQSGEIVMTRIVLNQN